MQQDKLIYDVEELGINIIKKEKSKTAKHSSYI